MAAGTGGCQLAPRAGTVPRGAQDLQGLATGPPATPGTLTWVSEDPLDSPRSLQVLLATLSPLGIKGLDAPPASYTAVPGRCSSVRTRVSRPMPPEVRWH